MSLQKEYSGAGEIEPTVEISKTLLYKQPLFSERLRRKAGQKLLRTNRQYLKNAHVFGCKFNLTFSGQVEFQDIKRSFLINRFRDTCSCKFSGQSVVWCLKSPGSRWLQLTHPIYSHYLFKSNLLQHIDTSRKVRVPPSFNGCKIKGLVWNRETINNSIDPWNLLPVPTRSLKILHILGTHFFCDIWNSLFVNFWLLQVKKLQRLDGGCNETCTMLDVLHFLNVYYYCHGRSPIANEHSSSNVEYGCSSTKSVLNFIFNHTFRKTFIFLNS